MRFVFLDRDCITVDKIVELIKKEMKIGETWVNFMLYPTPTHIRDEVCSIINKGRFYAMHGGGRNIRVDDLAAEDPSQN